MSLNFAKVQMEAWYNIEAVMDGPSENIFSNSDKRSQFSLTMLTSTFGSYHPREFRDA